MRRFMLMVLVCVLALAVFAAAASANTVNRPFKGAVTGGVWYQPVGDPPILTTMSAASGHARHMGLTRMTARHPTPPLGSSGYGPGEMVLTAANGDEVWITYTGHLEFDVSADAGTWFVGPVACTITGGTGRFDDATGSADMTLRILYPGSLDPALSPWAASWTWHGRIRY